MWVFVSQLGLRSGSRKRAWRWRSARYILAAEAKRPSQAPIRKKRQTRSQPSENLQKRSPLAPQSLCQPANPGIPTRLSKRLFGVTVWAKGLVLSMLRRIFGKSGSSPS